MRTIAADDVTRDFPQLLREVQNGATLIILSDGEPIARIGPVPDGKDAAACETPEAAGARKRAWQDHLATLRAQPALNLGAIRRDEIYDD